jgi:hypothetical protein
MDFAVERYASHFCFLQVNRILVMQISATYEHCIPEIAISMTLFKITYPEFG